MFGTKEVVVVDYNPDWQGVFLKLKHRIDGMIGDLIIGVEHVGSTSVPGLAAKPIIDFDVVIEDYSMFTEIKSRLARYGFEHLGNLDIEDREVFYKEDDEFEMDYHFYVCPQYGKGHIEHIAFRDYLIAHADAREAYGVLKRRLAEAYQFDVDTYCDKKTDFIRKILNDTLYRLEIRTPRLFDVDEMGRFFEVVIPHTFVKEGLPSDHETALEEIVEKKKQLLGYLNRDVASDYFIALKEGRIVGTIWYGPSGDLIKEGSCGTLGHLGEIGTVFVLPEYQGQRIGKQMMAHMSTILLQKGISAVTLDSGYAHAQKVWQHLFGQPKFVMKDQWGEGIDHMIWEIQL
ncbi:MAG: GNAT family N-acetyltransferase [Clostridia bacterium]|nr:GNAT family N-acetyltransferase [Clostridia bacterium]